FRFGSDTNTNDEGWYIDSVNFTTEFPENTKGVIPMNTGNPFYTTTQNPYTTSALNKGQSEIIVFDVMPTGELLSTYEFFAYANLTSNPSIGNITSKWNTTIIEDIRPISLNIQEPNATISDPTPILDVNILQGNPEVIWYNINGGQNTTICSGDCPEVSTTDWFNTDWLYRKELEISGTSSALSSFQVLLETNLTQEYTNGKIKSDCSDIRFAGILRNELDFWQESCSTSGQLSRFWIEIPSIPASTNTTIFMYYGNPTATSTSSGDDTFLVFDDFEDGIISPEWTSYNIEDGLGFTQESSGLLNVTGQGSDIWGANDDQRLVSQSLSGDFVLEGILDSVTWTSNPWAKASIIIKDSAVQDTNYAMIGETLGNGIAFQYNYNGNSNGASYTNPIDFRLIKSGSTVSGYYSSNGGSTWSQQGSAQDISTTDPVEVGMSSTSHTTTDYISAYWDLIK
ncbi:MAG: DUF2341 domain-containing protein, partial [Desulfobacterales bacterium]|nr:DUF2341 domain-containing protein [Desulfobacterales bacterium]